MRLRVSYGFCRQSCNRLFVAVKRQATGIFMPKGSPCLVSAGRPFFVCGFYWE